ncbi:hypothetical protein [Actinopolymorpha singaporensis]|uniref:Uncharacterized protein n=1 Tax=Actinopolymorpha singaporensis TaxID=117157 RepID=A0A1H1S2F8_9ACTN|nr:hypothetical protein [Actinopolymorpha singaporensis]SDS42063.1 hypothetical protein SAMN04489717_2638 [Actinopolymorpha singaporensis]
MSPFAEQVTVDARPSLWARWPAWAGWAAAGWSLAYGLLGVFWALGGAGFPFGADPYSVGVSPLENASAGSLAPVIAVVCLSGVVVAAAMARTWPRGRAGIPSVWFGWAMAVPLAVGVPDVRPLMGVARLPLLAVGAPFGWPKGVSVFGPGMFTWPVLNQLLLMLGGLCWAAATLAYQRRRRHNCAHCGRGRGAAFWTTPAAAARWGRWAVGAAVIMPLFYAVIRWSWFLGIPFGVTAEFLRVEAEDTPDIWLAGAMEGTLAFGGAVLTLGLVQRWGEVYPRWIPSLRGRPVRPRTAVIPAAVVTLLITTAGLGNLRALTGGVYPADVGENWGTIAPGLLWPLWAVGLGAATLAYHLRRRGRCRSCAA